jgi:hypothetical protein
MGAGYVQRAGPALAVAGGLAAGGLAAGDAVASVAGRAVGTMVTAAAAGEA